MSILLGVEFSGAWVRLVVVGRQAQVLARREEPLATPIELWWETHPEERHRALSELLVDAVRHGAFRPADVSAIGVTAPPALILLDADFVPIPPREISWGEVDPAKYYGRPWDALAALLGESPNACRRVGAVLDMVGFLRFRLSGGLGTDLDFAWSGGHIRSPKDPASWSTPSLEKVGLLPSQLPPIFPASQRVSVVAEETIERTGLRRGTWVCGGGDPLNTRLLFAAPPEPGRSVVRLLPEGVERFEVGPPPDQWTTDSVPTALDGVFLHRRDPSGWDPRTGSVHAESEGVVLDWGAELEPDLDACPGTLRIAADAGVASAGSAISAGLGLGWWRDPRPIFRKRRPPRTLAAFRTAGSVPEGATAEGGDSEEMGEAFDG